MKFSEKLYQLRTQNKLSQKKLADAIGVSQSSINYWEKGQREPSYTGAYSLAKYFNVTLTSLLDDNYDNLIKENHDLDTVICDNIVKLRKSKNLSQEKLSQLSGISIELIRDYENKIRIPKDTNKRKLAAVLDPEGSKLSGEDLPFLLYVDGDDLDSPTYSDINLITDDPKIRFSEYGILSYYRQLNELGKTEAEKRIAELTEIKKYIE